MSRKYVASAQSTIRMLHYTGAHGTCLNSKTSFSLYLWDTYIDDQFSRLGSICADNDRKQIDRTDCFAPRTCMWGKEYTVTVRVNLCQSLSMLFKFLTAIWAGNFQWCEGSQDLHNWSSCTGTEIIPGNIDQTGSWQSKNSNHNHGLHANHTISRLL